MFMNFHFVSANSFVCTGPIIYHFYRNLEKLVPKGEPYSKIKRLIIDRFLFSPPFILLFFVVTSLLQVRYYVDIS